MRFMRSRLTATPPRRASEPPLLPLRAPHGVNGTPSDWHVLKTAETCAVFSGKTMMSGG